MKTRLLLGLIATALFLGRIPAAMAGPAAPAGPTTPQRELVVVFVDSLHRDGAAFDTFNRLAYQFGKVFAARHWPVKVRFERFAANSGPYNLELRIFYQGIRNDFGERKLRAWMILHTNGTKHDFGIVEYRYWPRPGEQVSDMLDDLFRGEAQRTANLIEPYLVPTAAAPTR